MSMLVAYAPLNDRKEQVKDTLQRELERAVDPEEKLCDGRMQ